jgi:hypothetical protein
VTKFLTLSDTKIYIINVKFLYLLSFLSLFSISVVSVAIPHVRNTESIKIMFRDASFTCLLTGTGLFMKTEAERVPQLISFHNDSLLLNQLNLPQQRVGQPLPEPPLQINSYFKSTQISSTRGSRA